MRRHPARIIYLVILVCTVGVLGGFTFPGSPPLGLQESAADPEVARAALLEASGDDTDALVDALAGLEFADPFLLTVDATSYAYASNWPMMNVPVAHLDASGLLVVDDALPEVGSWSDTGFVWAPAVVALDDVYVLYYTSIDVASGLQCIGAATSTAPTGPFVDAAADALVCPTELGGAIDAEPIVDDGDVVLIWKADGNCCDLPTTIRSQRLDATGTRVVDPATVLIRATQEWEDGIVEAPSIVAVGRGYLLLYSGNDWASAEYATGYALCASVSGPCVKPGTDPVLETTTTRRGPGGADAIATTAGTIDVIIHRWEGADATVRTIDTATLEFTR